MQALHMDFHMIQGIFYLPPSRLLCKRHTDVRFARQKVCRKEERARLSELVPLNIGENRNFWHSRKTANPGKIDLRQRELEGRHKNGKYYMSKKS